MCRPDARETRIARAAHAARLALALAAAALACAPTGAQAAPEVTASLSPAELTLGAALTVSGRVLDGGVTTAEAPLQLQLNPYPYRGFATVARALSSADGTFAFAGVTLMLDTRLRVIVEGSTAPAGPSLHAIVNPEVATNALDLGAGRTRLTLRLRHAPQLVSSPVSAWWFVAARGTRVFRLAATTPTRELSSGLTYASATVAPPARHFVYRVCLNPAWERAMGPSGAHGRCPQQDFTVSRDVG
jgi:hypothetical protein